jgi:hypothetical protein
MGQANIHPDIASETFGEQLPFAARDLKDTGYMKEEWVTQSEFFHD